MHSRFVCRFLPILLLLVLPGTLLAQSRYPLKITRIQMGFPAGPDSGEPDADGSRMIFKAGVWSPLWVDIDCTADQVAEAELVVEVGDADDATTIARVPLPVMGKGNNRLSGFELSRIPYIKPGSFNCDVSVSIKSVSEQRNLADPVKKSFYGADSGKYFILGIGSSMNGFRLPRSETSDPNNPTEEKKHRNGRVELGQMFEVGQMPDMWFGYSAADVVLLTSGASENFWKSLSEAQYKTRRQALVEWVRRGGRIIVSAGANADLLNAIPEFKEMLPGQFPANGKRTVNSLFLDWSMQSQRQRETLEDTQKGKLFINEITPRPDRAYTVLMPTYVGNKPDFTKPLIVQGAYGLGRVTMVGFDLDRPPLVDWPQRLSLFEWLVNESSAKLPSGNERSDRYMYGNNPEDQQTTQMQSMLDSFEGVPVISFGWVALFILLYILLIGPVDYFFLKKVVKKLEWTWITFPIIVLSVSAIAYFTAYALKGRDLKINKVDLVDIDLQTKRLYGKTWFTLFSPRIQNYTIGIEPIGPGDGHSGWTTDKPAEFVPQTLLSGYGKIQMGREGFFRRSYQYVCDSSNPDEPLYAVGLEQVPIQVWSTKSFVGEWSARLSGQQPLISHTLHHVPGQEDLIHGTITCNIPVASLDNAYLFYRDKAIQLGTLTPGVERTISPKAIDKSINQAIMTNLNELAPRSSSSSAGPTLAGFSLMPLLFHDKAVSGTSQNVSMRTLDQSWRVSERSYHEAILVARLRCVEGLAEEMSQKPESATRLWLSELPGGIKPRTPLQGTIRQETYVRVFIPIPTLEKK